MNPCKNSYSGEHSFVPCQYDHTMVECVLCGKIYIANPLKEDVDNIHNKNIKININNLNYEEVKELVEFISDMKQIDYNVSLSSNKDGFKIELNEK